MDQPGWMWTVEWRCTNSEPGRELGTELLSEPGPDSSCKWERQQGDGGHLDSSSPHTGGSLSSVRVAAALWTQRPGFLPCLLICRRSHESGFLPNLPVSVKSNLINLKHCINQATVYTQGMGEGAVMRICTNAGAGARLSRMSFLHKQ